MPFYIFFSNIKHLETCALIIEYETGTIKEEPSLNINIVLSFFLIKVVRLL